MLSCSSARDENRPVSERLYSGSRAQRAPPAVGRLASAGGARTLTRLKSTEDGRIPQPLRSSSSCRAIKTQTGTSRSTSLPRPQTTAHRPRTEEKQPLVPTSASTSDVVRRKPVSATKSSSSLKTVRPAIPTVRPPNARGTVQQPSSKPVISRTVCSGPKLATAARCNGRSVARGPSPSSSSTSSSAAYTSQEVQPWATRRQSRIVTRSQQSNPSNQRKFVKLQEELAGRSDSSFKLHDGLPVHDEHSVEAQKSETKKVVMATPCREPQKFSPLPSAFLCATTSISESVASQGCGGSSRRRRRRPLADKHIALAPWMKSVDAVVADGDHGRMLDRDRLAAAARSLGQLGLMAAEAAEGIPTPYLPTTTTIIDCCDVDSECSIQHAIAGLKSPVNDSPRKYSISHYSILGESFVNRATPQSRIEHMSNIITATSPAYPSEMPKLQENLADHVTKTPRCRGSIISRGSASTPCVVPTNAYSQWTHRGSGVGLLSQTSLGRVLSENRTPSPGVFHLSSSHRRRVSASGTPMAPRRGIMEKGKRDLLRGAFDKDGLKRNFTGIRMNSVNAVKQAIRVNGADPNAYFTISSCHVPWTLAYPGLELARDMSEVQLHPLLLAVACSTPAVVAELLRLGACVGAVDTWGRNGLHILLQPPCVPGMSGTSHVHEKMFEFLIGHPPTRPAKVDVIVAELLCEAGLDTDQEDIWGRSCTDYLSEWSAIRRLIVSKQVNNVPEQQEIVFRRDSTDIPLPCRPPRTSDPDITKTLLSRIPHELMDTIVLQAGRARLEAIAPIVGIDIGLRSPRCMVAAPQHRLLNTTTPTNKPNATPVSSKVHGGPHITTTSSRVSCYSGCPSQQASGSSYCSGMSSGCFFGVRSKSRRQRLRPSIGVSTNMVVTEVINEIMPENCSYASTVTLYPPPKPGVARVSIRRSALEALSPKIQKETPRRQSPPISSLPLTQRPNDLTKFFKLASEHRFHPALSGVWEFLGADLFPNQHGGRNHNDDTSSSPSLKTTPVII